MTEFLSDNVWDKISSSFKPASQTQCDSSGAKYFTEIGGILLKNNKLLSLHNFHPRVFRRLVSWMFKNEVCFKFAVFVSLVCIELQYWLYKSNSSYDISLQNYVKDWVHITTSVPLKSQTNVFQSYR